MLTAEEVKSDKKARAELVERVRAGAHFTCFTSAKSTSTDAESGRDGARVRSPLAL